jgi:hypothetical protein
MDDRKVYLAEKKAPIGVSCPYPMNAWPNTFVTTVRVALASKGERGNTPKCVDGVNATLALEL